MNDFDFKSYIDSPSPIEKELRSLWKQEDEIVIFDVGACEGEDSIRYSKLYPSSRIYSFEPLPKNAAKIDENFQLYDVSNASMCKYALSETDGLSEFYVSSGCPEWVEHDTEWDFGNKSSSLLKPTQELKSNFSWLKFGDKISVKTQRVDTFCAKNSIARIDFMHLDVQGAELSVLKGCGVLLSTVKCVWMEVEEVALYEGQPLRADVEGFMRANGFKMLRDCSGSVSGDQLYVKP